MSENKTEISIVHIGCLYMYQHLIEVVCQLYLKSSILYIVHDENHACVLQTEEVIKLSHLVKTGILVNSNISLGLSCTLVIQSYVFKQLTLFWKCHILI